MPDFIYPSAVALRQVSQELAPRLAANRRAFDILPLNNVDDDLLIWEQRDNFIGLQQIRGINGEPTRVKLTGGKRYSMSPGYYGEYQIIDEMQLTRRRPWGTFTGAIDVGDLVLEAQQKLLQRELDRQELIVWTLLATGTFSVSDGAAVLQTDSYTTQTFAAGVPWATIATSTPLADIRAIQLKSRGYSVNFGAAARMYMNRTTFNALLSNTNAGDLGGRRGAGLSSINGPAQLNELLAMDDLPAIVVYDDGYIDETGTFQLFIPNNKVIVVGARRDNDPVGEYRITRSAMNPDMGPGSYDKVVDDPDEVPRTVIVHRGHAGGPILWHPAAVVVATV
jgi:hypothetical protein